MFYMYTAMCCIVSSSFFLDGVAHDNKTEISGRHPRFQIAYNADGCNDYPVHYCWIYVLSGIDKNGKSSKQTLTFILHVLQLSRTYAGLSSRLALIFSMANLVSGAQACKLPSIINERPCDYREVSLGMYGEGTYFIDKSFLLLMEH